MTTEDVNPKLVQHIAASRRPFNWLKFPEFLLKKDEPLTEEAVSRFHEEFVNSKDAT